MKLLRPRDYVDLARRSVKGWVEDNAPTMGAALAFYTLLTLAPLLMVVLGLAGYVVGRDEAHNALVAQVALLLGDQAAMGVEGLLDLAGMREPGVTPALIGAVVMFIASTTVFAELRADLDRIWRHKPDDARGWMRQVGSRASAFLMVMTIGLLLVASMLASTFLAALGSRWFAGSQATLHALEFLTSFVAITLLFAAVYKILPSKRIAWSDVWVGAAVTSLLFWVGKFAIALYIGRAAVDSSFGAAGALVVLILWVYYSAQVFFLGAEFTKQYAMYHGSRRHERTGRRLADMNATYDDLIERAKRITSGRRDPIFGK
ncbi:MAG TPA: YihY/virulence factor BrkB family protein [Usitatibacter sp.]|nr:YihY/virulence factor BrkB family protein [Usitatibacter sp.]